MSAFQQPKAGFYFPLPLLTRVTPVRSLLLGAQHNTSVCKMSGITVVGLHHWKAASPLLPLGVIVIPATLRITFAFWPSIKKLFTTPTWLQRVFNWYKPVKATPPEVRTGKQRLPAVGCPKYKIQILTYCLQNLTDRVFSRSIRSKPPDDMTG